jgi:hypothetical protein
VIRWSFLRFVLIGPDPVLSSSKSRACSSSSHGSTFSPFAPGTGVRSEDTDWRFEELMNGLAYAPGSKLVAGWTSGNGFPDGVV